MQKVECYTTDGNFSFEKPKLVTAFQTSSGRIFETAKQAASHELLCKIQENELRWDYHYSSLLDYILKNPEEVIKILTFVKENEK